MYFYHRCCFLLLLIATSIDGLFYFKKLELRRQAKLLKSQSSDSDLWIEQKLDNFQPQDTRKWMQRYFMRASLEKKNGPVFLNIGGEGPASPVWMENGHWIDMAKQFGARCFMLEHRFYGKSHPTSDLSDENLNYLSSEQALADISNFIVNMTEKHNLNHRKWIVFGGSYSGALAVWARLKYPHLVSGAVSASAPLNALVNFKEYSEVVNNALKNYGSASCVANVAKATSTVAQELKSASGRLLLQAVFNLCEPLDESGYDNENFQQSLAGNIMGVVQYNRDNRDFEGGVGGNITVKTVCAIMDDTTLGEPLNRYANLNQLLLDTYGEKCLDASYSEFIKEMSDTRWSSGVGGRAWTYQTCSEFGWYQSSDSTSQPFVGFPIAFQLDQCKSVFGLSPSVVDEAVKRTNEHYGALSVAGVVSNVTLYNGGVDPWHAVSYVSPQPKYKFRSGSLEMKKQSSEYGIVSIFVPDTAHCAPNYPARSSDSPLLVQARRTIEQAVATWLGVSQKLRLF